MRSWQSASPALLAIQDGLYPIEYGWHRITAGISHLFRVYVRLSDAAQENIGLRQQLAGMQTRIMDYEEQLLENDRLRKLLGFASRAEHSLIAAEVIGHTEKSPFQAIRIAKGREAGVRIGMPVVAADGIVGRVIRSGHSYADVQLLVDTDFHIDVLLQRTRVRGVLTGADLSYCKLQLHRRVEIRIGDTIITSGIVGGFPKGLPVGRVIRISYETENVAQSVSVEPWVDHRRLEEVMVIMTKDRELEKIVETAGPGWLERATDESRSHGTGG